MIIILSLLACSLTMMGQWLVSQGRLRAVYFLMIINGTLYTSINILLAAYGNSGVLFLAIPSGWAVVAGCIGLRRLYKASKS